MMAVRVAYFKLYYPLQFYAVFFSVRSDAYDIETMIAGEDAIIAKIEALRARKDNRQNPLSNKEANQLKTLLVCLELYERGFHIANIDVEGKELLEAAREAHVELESIESEEHYDAHDIRRIKTYYEL